MREIKFFTKLSRQKRRLSIVDVENKHYRDLNIGSDNKIQFMENLLRNLRKIPSEFDIALTASKSFLFWPTYLPNKFNFCLINVASSEPSLILIRNGLIIPESIKNWQDKKWFGILFLSFFYFTFIKVSRFFFLSCK